MIEIVGLTIVWLLLLILKGFFSGSEIALVNADKIKLQAHAEQGHSGSKLAAGMFRRPERLLATTLVGTNIATVSLAVLTTTFFLQLFGDGGDLLALLVGTPVLLIFGEIVPKSVYQQSADRLTPIISYPLKLFSWLFFPVVLVFSSVARLLTKIFLGGKAARTPFVVREQLRALIDMSERATDVTVFDRVRIKNVIRFANITVGEVMTPIADVVGIPRTARMSDAIKCARQSGHRDVPIYDGNISNIVGVVSLSTWDLVDADLVKRPLDAMVRSPHFVTANEPVDELLSVLRSREDHMAIVVDEYESAVGLVTVKNVTSLIVGQIDGRREAETSPAPESVDSGNAYEEDYLVQARLRISDMNEMLGTSLTADNFHTVGGLMAFHLRRVPRVGDQLEEEGLRLTVMEGTKRGPTRVRIERLDSMA